MKAKDIELRDLAWQEWQDAALHYELEQPQLGSRFDTAVLKAIEDLVRVTCSYPERVNGFRYAPVEGFPYCIVFELTDGLAIVYSVFHMSRRPLRPKRRRR
jgi:hypothetical protein